MTDQPTDHRAQAEEWLSKAAREYPRSLEHANPSALIGIGHALLALVDAQTQPVTTINLSGNATREQIRDVLERHGKAD